VQRSITSVALSSFPSRLFYATHEYFYLPAFSRLPVGLLSSKITPCRTLFLSIKSYRCPFLKKYRAPPCLLLLAITIWASISIAVVPQQRHKRWRRGSNLQRHFRRVGIQGCLTRRSSLLLLLFWVHKKVREIASLIGYTSHKFLCWWASPVHAMIVISMHLRESDMILSLRCIGRDAVTSHFYVMLSEIKMVGVLHAIGCEQLLV